MKLFMVIGLLFLAGCEYAPNEIYEIETKDGGILKLLCPVVDPGRSELTYFHAGECKAIK